MRTEAFILFLSPACHAFDLQQAWRAAKAHSADYAAARHNRDAEAEQKQRAKSALLPQINLEGSLRRQPASLSSNTKSRD